jgi:putative ATP-binding cassette transporter
VAQVGLAAWGNWWNRALFDALEARSVAGVLVQVGVFAAIFALSIVVTAAHLMVKRWLQLDWRRWLTDRLVGRWMADGRHYRLAFAEGEHDNPDQRIAEDIRIATESAVALAHTLVFSVMILGTFIDILWNVSGTLRVPGTALEVAGYLVPLAFLYAGAGSLVGWMFGRPLVRTTNALQSAEASFRFGLARAREHAEAIALMHGERMERAGAAARFRQVVRDWDRQSLAYMGIVSFATGYGALLPVFPILVAAPHYIAGVMTLGVLMQAAQAFQRVTSALSWPVDNLGEIARWRASVDRVLSLHEDMARLDREALEPGEGRIVLGRSGKPLLVVDGLWPWGRGRVLLPGDGALLFMPQRPFLPEGTLREALCYPRPPDAWTDACIRQALECAGLAWLAPRLDERDNWDQALPLRAQQRLGFARALMQRPAWLFMEEATDAFDPRGERLILEMLHRELPDTAIVTISFHAGLEPLHTRKLVLNRATPLA